ncbi:hypothetical protein HPB50_013027 [Hyalomma asiaticum]|uniref:Uncharacterized protein n=1 Tax=Hyalomma asiaticum TaxID=266040 RepID=A0ACB7RRT1_HYAAI|nr:hypothetical protein HPB50_013027 [Hyalomma asiaticum]
MFAEYGGLQEPRLVYPRLLEERSSDGKLVLHVHDGLTLNLEQASVAVPQLRVIEELDDATITHMHDGNEINSNLYQDRQRLATVEVKRRENSAEISCAFQTGIVGPDHRIEPAPAMERSESGLIPHLVHEIKHVKVHDQAVPFMEKVKSSRLTARNDYNNYGYPEKVTVEVFLVTDDTYYSKFKGPKEALVYACMLLNSSQDDLYHSYTLQYDMSTLSSFQKYGVKKKAEFGNPDILFHLSGSDESYGNWVSGATGIAYVGGVCSEYYVGLAQDDATLFSGVYIVTHELGHL